MSAALRSKGKREELPQPCATAGNHPGQRPASPADAGGPSTGGSPRLKTGAPSGSSQLMPQLKGGSGRGGRGARGGRLMQASRSAFAPWTPLTPVNGESTCHQSPAPSSSSSSSPALALLLLHHRPTTPTGFNHCLGPHRAVSSTRAYYKFVCQIPLVLAATGLTFKGGNNQIPEPSFLPLSKRGSPCREPGSPCREPGRTASLQTGTSAASQVLPPNKRARRRGSSPARPAAEGTFAQRVIAARWSPTLALGHSLRSASPQRGSALCCRAELGRSEG